MFDFMVESIEIKLPTLCFKILTIGPLFCFLILYFLCIADAVLCVGSEWHRYPSSFIVPNYVGEVRWIDDGFRGLLPLPFNSSLGGTSAAPPYFNNKNKASDEQYVNLPFPSKEAHM